MMVRIHVHVSVRGFSPDYSCAMQKDILVHGRLYVTQNWICFYANIFTWETVVGGATVALDYQRRFQYVHVYLTTMVFLFVR